MAESSNALEFKVITDESSDVTKTYEEFQKYIKDVIQKTDLISDNYIAYVIDNINDPITSNKALLLRIKGGETQVFYNSTDTFLKSKSEFEKATSSDNGLMSVHDYALLRNLDSNLNINDTNAVVVENNEILKNIIEVDEDNTKSEKNKIYKFKENKISTIEEMLDRISTLEKKIDEIETFLGSDTDDIVYQYNNLSEYIEELINQKDNMLVSKYVNHTHKNFK